MKIFTKITLLVLICLLSFTFMMPKISIASEIEINNQFNFIDFLKEIDQYVYETKGQLFVSDTNEVKLLIKSNYTNLTQIELFRERTQNEIFDEIINKIYGFQKNNSEFINRSTDNYYWTTYWWGGGYKFFSKSQALQYANDIDYVRIYPSSASAAIIVMGSAYAAAKLATSVSSAYLLTLSNDIKANAAYLDSFALDISWVLIYTIYAI